MPDVFAERDRVPTLWMHDLVGERLLNLRAAPWETGGWLLGYWTADEATVVVTHATPPGPRGTPLGIRISGRGHRPRFDAAWEASRGHVTFLGDWHTHPGGPPAPSRRDRSSLTQLATSEQFGTPRPLGLIVANPRWRWSRTERRFRCYLRQPDGRLKGLDPQLFEVLPPAAAAVPCWNWPSRS